MLSKGASYLTSLETYLWVNFTREMSFPQVIALPLPGSPSPFPRHLPDQWNYVTSLLLLVTPITFLDPPRLTLGHLESVQKTHLESPHPSVPHPAGGSRTSASPLHTCVTAWAPTAR